MPETAAGVGDSAQPDLRHTTVEALIRHRLMTALGGVRGSIEASLPMLGFVIVWLTRHDARLGLIVAAVIAVLLGVVRVVQRKPLQFVLTGLFGVAIAWFFVRLTGSADGVFLPGIIKSAGLGLAYVISNVVRWPFVGFLIGTADPDYKTDPFAWHRHPEIIRVCQKLTWVLAAIFIVRVAVQLPLYLAGKTDALGISAIALGWPLFGAAIAVMGWMLARGQTPYEPLPARDADAA